MEDQIKLTTGNSLHQMPCKFLPKPYIFKRNTGNIMNKINFRLKGHHSPFAKIRLAGHYQSSIILHPFTYYLLPHS
jgi:hypothetical protein